MIILGIDPGYAIVGYGVVEYRSRKFRVLGYGAITTEAHTPMEKRLSKIHRDMKDIIERFHPDELAIEELFFNTNLKTGIKVAQARGVVLSVSDMMGLKVYEYTPLQVKQAVVGYGRAQKKQVIAMVDSILELRKSPKLDDTSDALALCICHAHTCASRLKQYFNN